MAISSDTFQTDTYTSTATLSTGVPSPAGRSPPGRRRRGHIPSAQPHGPGIDSVPLMARVRIGPRHLPGQPISWASDRRLATPARVRTSLIKVGSYAHAY